MLFHGEENKSGCYVAVPTGNTGTGGVALVHGRLCTRLGKELFYTLFQEPNHADLGFNNFGRVYGQRFVNNAHFIKIFEVSGKVG